MHGASQVEIDQLDGLIARLGEQAKLSAQSEQHSETLRADLKQHVDRPLAEFISRVQMRLEPDTTLAFICDQFEELFVHFGNTPALDEFVAQIGEVWADSSLRVRILFSMREDWVGSLIEFRKAIPDIFRDYFKLKPITRSRAGHVLTLPLEAVGGSMEQSAVDAILDDLAASYVRTQRERFSGINLTPSPTDDPFIELPALQVVADRLWATRNRASTPFSLSHYRSLGNHGPAGKGSASPAQTVLDEYLADLLAGAEDSGDLTPREFLELRLDCLYLLTDRVRHRRALPEGLLLEELKQIRPQPLDLPEVTAPRLQQALQPLERRRLVREDVSRSGDRQYELAHDFAVRSVVAAWRQLDRERTATLALLERERKQTEQKVAVLEDADRRSTRLLQLAPLFGFAALVVALFATQFSNDEGLSYRPFLTGLLILPFLSVLIAGLLRGHTPSAVFGGVGLIGTGGVALLSGYDTFGGLALLAAALVPLYLWSGHSLSLQIDSSRLARLFGTLWTEYVELLKIVVAAGVALAFGGMGGGMGGEEEMLLFVTLSLVTTSVSGYQIARRGYQTGHSWTALRVTRTNGESLSVTRGIIRQLGLLAWIGLVVLAGWIVSRGIPLIRGDDLVPWAVLAIIAWISGAAFIAGLDEEQRHVYDRLSGAHVTSKAASPPAPAVSSSFDVPRMVKSRLVPAFAVAVIAVALVAFVRPVDFGFSQLFNELHGASIFAFNRAISIIAGGILAISGAAFFVERTKRIASVAVFATFAVQLLFTAFETLDSLFLRSGYLFASTGGRMFNALETAALTLTVLAVATTAGDRAQKRIDTARVAFAVGLIGSSVLFLLSFGLGGGGLMMLWTAVVQVTSIATGILLLLQRHASRACLVLAATLALSLIFGALGELSRGSLLGVWIPRSLISVIGTAIWAALLAPRRSEASSPVEAAAAIEPA